MPDSTPSAALAAIHFPQRITLIKNLRYISFLVNDVVLLVSCIVLFVWITNFQALQHFLFEKLGILPASSVLFLLAGVALLFGARRHLTESEDAKKDIYPWWNFWVPILFAVTTCALGFISLTHLNILTSLHISPSTGLCFFLIGLSLIPPFTRIPHRFHITQLLLFLVSAISMLVILENIYGLFSSLPMKHFITMPLSLAVTFAFFCLGILLRWSNRGFFGNFTLDSTGSRFALRIVIINLLSTPCIAFVVLFSLQKTQYNMSQTLTIIIILLTFTSSLLIWINVKLLYRYSLEHLLMRESLRSHNIDLTTEKEKLERSLAQSEQDKRQYEDKLTMQNAWRNAADTLR